MKSPVHYLNSVDVIAELKTDRQGLTSKEAGARLSHYGPNQLTETKQAGPVVIFFSQFKDLLVIILIIAAIISLISGSAESTLVIFAVIILNAVLGTVQTLKARKSLESLKAMSAPIAKVIHDGEIVEVRAADIVPGDILLLEAGDMVNADGRIIENYSLKVNESALTGESESVEKTDQRLTNKDVALGDQINMVFSGSLVTYGRAFVVVTSTGMDTEIGKIAQLMNDISERKTLLQVSLDAFSARLAALVLAISVLVFILSIFRSGLGVLDALMFAVALAVAAIPEALATIVTIVLALGTQKIAQQHAIMKDLKAVETLGSVSVICSDKTGTLTQNKMTVEKMYTYGHLKARDDFNSASAVERMLVRIGLLASDAITNEERGTAVGDPTEIAMVEVGDWLGIDEVDYRNRHPRLRELAFDSDRKLMTTLHELKGQPTLLTKGALDVILGRSVAVQTTEGEVPLTSEIREELLRVNNDLSSEGLRVLAFAYRRIDEVRDITFDDETDFIFVGLMAMMDPPRPESIQAVADAKRGGIRTIMITGDHKVTASAIARRIGIMEDGDQALEGVELDAMDDDALDAAIDKVSVYARVSPEHKIRIVDAWQRRGCIVSMTGDGVNDAPALKKADIGVAMGITGTEVSKDAASMILSDDNFATIVQAVVNGRSVYTNIRHTILFLLSGNAAGIFCVLGASLAGLPAPFAAVHLLFINLLTDSLPAIAIGMEPARSDLLDQKPRDPHEPLLNKRLFARVCGQGILIALATMTSFMIGLTQSGIGVAMTMAFVTLSLARLFHGFNCRNDHSIAKVGLLSNKYTLWAFLGGVALLCAVLFIPALYPFLLVEALSGAQLLWVAGLAFVPTLCIQVVKMVSDHRASDLH